MKRWVLAGVWLCCSLVHGEEGFRIFTDAQGRAITARILTYDARKQTVLVQMEDGRQGKLPVSQLSDADKQFVQKWVVVDGIQSESKFKVSCERRRTKAWSEEQFGTIRYTNGASEENQVVGKIFYEETAYEITMLNRNEFPLEGIVVKYCIYYKQDVSAPGEGQPGVLYGSEVIKPIAKFEKAELMTQPVVVYKDMKDSSFLNARVLNGEVDGIVLKICLKDQGGEESVRIIALPEKLLEDHKWVENSVSVGQQSAGKKRKN